MSTTLHDEVWELTPADRLLVEAKRWGNQPRFAVMLLFTRARGCCGAPGCQAAASRCATSLVERFGCEQVVLHGVIRQPVVP